MVNACAGPDFLFREGGGGGSKPVGEKTALIFFMFVFGFFSPKFSGDAGGGVQLFTGGGGPNANSYRI